MRELLLSELRHCAAVPGALLLVLLGAAAAPPVAAGVAPSIALECGSPDSRTASCRARVVFVLPPDCEPAGPPRLLLYDCRTAERKRVGLLPVRMERYPRGASEGRGSRDLPLRPLKPGRYEVQAELRFLDRERRAGSVLSTVHSIQVDDR